MITRPAKGYIVNQKEAWEFSLDAVTLSKVKNTAEFHQIITLARIVNAMRFLRIAGWDVKDDNSPSDRRQRFNMFLYLSAVVWEGMKFVKRMGKLFHTYPAFKQGFTKILESGAATSLLPRIEPMRNQASFHFDESAVEQALSGSVGMDTPFATGRGESVLDCYYDLADIAALRLIDPTCQSESQFREKYSDVIKQTEETALKFLDAADNLIVEYLLAAMNDGRYPPKRQKGVT
jgi:hypothetical protein